jgi:hypothetical protein
MWHEDLEMNQGVPNDSPPCFFWKKSCLKKIEIDPVYPEKSDDEKPFTQMMDSLILLAGISFIASIVLLLPYILGR